MIPTSGWLRPVNENVSTSDSLLRRATPEPPTTPGVAVSKRHSGWVLSLAIGLASSATAVAVFGASGRDDSHITYWAARQLARHGRILNYNGDRVEQSSSLLQTVMLAALSLVTQFPIPLLGWWLGLACGTATVVAVWAFTQRVAPPAAIPAAILTATSTGLVYWEAGGMDTTIASLTFVGFVAAVTACVTQSFESRSGWHWFGLATVLYSIVRPEAPLVELATIGLTTVFATATTGGSPALFRRAARAGATVFAVAVVVATARQAYFGIPVPLPVLAKVRGIEVDRGMSYLLENLATDLGFTLSIIVAAIAILRTRSFPTWLSAPTAGAASVVLFVVTSGGDWMEGGRLLVPALPLIAIVSATSVARTATAQVLVGALVVAHLVTLVRFAGGSSLGTPLPVSVNMAERVEREVKLDYSWPEMVNREHYRDTFIIPVLLDVIRAVHAHTGETVTLGTGLRGGPAVLVLRARSSYRDRVDAPSRGEGVDGSLLTNQTGPRTGCPGFRTACLSPRFIPVRTCGTRHSHGRGHRGARARM